MSAHRYARAIYWRALPGQMQAYTDYLRDEVEPVDDEARRRGALSSFETLIDPRPDAPWTHMRLFVFDTPAQRDSMVQAFAQIMAERQPDPALRQARAERAARLRERIGEADYDLL